MGDGGCLSLLFEHAANNSSLISDGEAPLPLEAPSMKETCRCGLREKHLEKRMSIDSAHKHVYCPLFVVLGKKFQCVYLPNKT